MIERATQRLGPLGIPPEIGKILQGSFLLAAVIALIMLDRCADGTADSVDVVAGHPRRFFRLRRTSDMQPRAHHLR